MIKLLAILPIVLLALLDANPTTAQEERNWYQVDIVIFSNEDSAALTGEAWPVLPHLEYPERLQHLQPETLMRLPEPPGNLVTVEQSSPALPLDLAWEKSIAELWQDYAELLAAQEEATPAALDMDSTGAMVPEPAALEPVAEPPELPIPTPFVLLEDARRGLRPEQRRLRRSAGRRVLFHESWLQPLRDQQESAAIVISSDDLHGDYPELQGSIQLYVSRYLHIETQLWLNTSGGYLEDAWRIPAAPVPPLANQPDRPGFQVQLPANWWHESRAIPVGDPRFVVPGGTGTEPGTMDSSTAGLMPRPMTTSLAVEPPDYPFGHAIAIEQSRRMRSGELHYIDHPLVGILIVVSAWEFAPWQVNAGDISSTGL
jgi:hypothetical protein